MKLNRGILLLLTLSFLIVWASGCVQQEPKEVKPPFKGFSQSGESAIISCITTCNNARDSGKDLSNGPCLLDPVPGQPDWVCDVAHDPRKPVDNNPENQCQAYLNGSAHHFVEVSPNCGLVRVY